MKLLEALQVVAAADASAPQRTIDIACGFTPLHLSTFLVAALQQRSSTVQVVPRIGLFGDLIGNVERAAGLGASETAVFVEWFDLDPRLGWRRAGGWLPDRLDDINESVARALTSLETAVSRLTKARSEVCVSLPTLPLAPASYMPGRVLSPFEARLLRDVAAFRERLARMPRVRVLNSAQLDAESPVSVRHDPRSELTSGFPYQQSFAAQLANGMAELMSPPARKKGLVTDLDDTLWRGILGDEGATGITGSPDRGAYVHAIYQQMLLSLGATGVLLAIASKNDASAVKHAFANSDTQIPLDSFYPVEAHWQPKSTSLAAILKAWNVGADSIVFVDDSPSELAEVKSRLPEVECLLFPKDDLRLIPAFAAQLRALFGKFEIHAEDRVRLQSLKSAVEISAASDAGTDYLDEFLSGVDAKLTIEISRDAEDARAIELVNKTNQFNLNGRRVSNPEWRSHFDASGSFLLTAQYSDKFGALGKIAVMTGTVRDDVIRIDRWVMSCRAFSRRIEFQCLAVLFRDFPAESLVLDYTETSRNGPFLEFLNALGVGDSAPPLQISREQFEHRCPRLYHTLLRPAEPTP